MLRYVTRGVLFILGAALPLETIAYTSYGVLTITPNKAIGLVMLVFGALDLLVSGIRVPRNPKNYWVAALVVAMAIGCIYGSFLSGTGSSYYVVLWIRYGSLVTFYFLLCQLIGSRRDLDAFLYGLVCGGVLAAVSAMVGEAAVHYSVERRSGVGAGANQHAGNLLLTIPITYALFLSTRRALMKPILVGTALFLSAGVVLAASRSAFLAALAMGGVWMLRFRRLSDLRYVALALLAFLVGALAAPEAYFDRIATIGEAIGMLTGSSRGGAGDLTLRLEQLTAGVHAFVSGPFGAGAGNFGKWASREGYTLAAEYVVHNAILEVASQYGIVGLVPYLAILVLTWTHLSRVQSLARGLRTRRDAELEQLGARALMLQIGFLGIAIVAQFQPGFPWKGMWACFGLSTAILALAQRRAQALRASDAPTEPLALERPAVRSLRTDPI